MLQGYSVMHRAWIGLCWSSEAPCGMEPACRIADPRPKAYGCRAHFSTCLGCSIQSVYTELKITALCEERLAFKMPFFPLCWIHQTNRIAALSVHLCRGDRLRTFLTAWLHCRFVSSPHHLELPAGPNGIFMWVICGLYCYITWPEY